MTEILFDEFDEFFRYPAGAVKTGETLRLRLKVRRGLGRGAKLLYNADGCEPRSLTMCFTAVHGSYDVFETEVFLEKPDLYWYSFLVLTEKGGFHINSAGISEYNGSGLQLTVYNDTGQGADWLQGGIIYHIFVDRFRRGTVPANIRADAVFREDWGGCPEFLPDSAGIVRNNDFFGGDFSGIIEKLPYLAELGVSCLYLSPVFEAASNHKYDTGDFLKIDKSFGGDEAFERLISEAAKYGIKIMLDGVFSHVGEDSRYFNRYGHYDSQGAYQSRESVYFDWFTFHEWNTNYESWWGIQLLPAINKLNVGYREFICGENGVIAHWMKKGVAAWRLDVADELPDAFLYPLCEAVKREKSDALIIGEVWEDASNKISYGVRRKYLLGGQLDSVINYPLKDAIIAFLKDNNIEFLAETMSRLCQNYPPSALNSLMNVLGTHDTMRILTVFGGTDLPVSKTEMAVYRLNYEQRERAKRLLKLASVLQFTLPGIPCVYYGDEAGLEGGADPFNRRCFPWGSEDLELTAWYKKLARIRKQCPCLKDGKYRLASARDGLFAFTRGQENDKILVAINISDEDMTLECGSFKRELISERYIETCVVKSGEAAVFQS